MSDQQYDQLAGIYDAWCEADPAAEETHRYYLSECVREPGTVVELGVGTGRIALDVAATGKPVLGIDESQAMLEQCRRKSAQRGLTHLVTVERADVASFTSLEKADLIILPFRTIGHLLTNADRLEAFCNIRRNLRPDGRFVFDHYVLDPAWASSRHGVPKMMCRVPLADGYQLVWDTYWFDFRNQQMDCTITIETVSSAGFVIERRHARLSFSWVQPHEIADLARRSGLEVESLNGDFAGGVFDASSTNQVWVLRRPGTTAGASESATDIGGT